MDEFLISKILIPRIASKQSVTARIPIRLANGQTRKFWERNLRLKTDASDNGPEKNAPALVGAGMMGDRADVIFADPNEISAFIIGKC